MGANIFWVDSSPNISFFVRQMEELYLKHSGSNYVLDDSGRAALMEQVANTSNFARGG